MAELSVSPGRARGPETHLRFAVEQLGQWVPDAHELIIEEAIERGIAPLDPLGDEYLLQERAGSLVCIAARSDGELIGYLLYRLYLHRHYNLLTADPDLFYVGKKWRSPRLNVGRGLLRCGQAVLKLRGVKLLCARVPCGARHGILYQRLGFDEVETLYVKKL